MAYLANRGDDMEMRHIKTQFDLGRCKNVFYSPRDIDSVKEVIAEMPEGYVLEITGHHNQHPDKDKRKDDGKGGLSRQRAKDVYNYFVKNGVPKEKMTYRGAGSAERDESLSREKNRRVTFKLVKAGA